MISIDRVPEQGAVSFSLVMGFPQMTPMTYGYLFTVLLKILYLLSGGKEAMIYILLKLINIICIVILSQYLGKIVDLFHGGEKGVTGLFILLNPIIHTQYMISGHNDVLMALFMTMGLYYLFKKKYLLSYLLFFMALHIKCMALIVLPLVFIYSIKSRVPLSKILPGVLLFLVSFLPYPLVYGIKSLSPGLRGYRMSVDASFSLVFYYVIDFVYKIHPGDFLLLFKRFSYGWFVVYGIILMRFNKVAESIQMGLCRYAEILIFVYIVFFSTVLYPWYILWIIPFVCCSKEVKIIFLKYSVLFLWLEIFYTFFYMLSYKHPQFYRPSVLISFLVLAGIYMIFRRILSLQILKRR